MVVYLLIQGDGNGIFDASNDGLTVSSAFNFFLEDTLDISSNLLNINSNNSSIGIGTPGVSTDKVTIISGTSYFSHLFFIF